MSSYEAENRHLYVKCDGEYDGVKIDHWNGLSSILGFCVG